MRHKASAGSAVSELLLPRPAPTVLAGLAGIDGDSPAVDSRVTGSLTYGGWLTSTKLWRSLMETGGGNGREATAAARDSP
jgi:hypothetical protein